MSPPTAIILAGGFGTRLRTVVSDLPKPMAPVRGKPFLDYQLSNLYKQGIKNVIMSTGHLAEKVSAHYGEQFMGMALSYSVEHTPLGTGGAIRQALSMCGETSALVMNGDSLFDIDLNKFGRLHNAAGSPCSIALRTVPDVSRYGAIEIDGQNNVVRFSEKTTKPRAGFINAGIYILDKKTFLGNIPDQQAFSIESDFFMKASPSLGLKAFPFDGYFIDIGIPADYERAQHEFERFEN